jgi:ATP-dependent RNA helicase DDX50
MSQHEKVAVVDDEGAFENFPDIHPKTVDLLKKRGINSLFQVQYSSFKTIMNRKDLIVRDLTGSGKTLGFALPLVEYLRKNKCFGTGKI